MTNRQHKTFMQRYSDWKMDNGRKNGFLHFDEFDVKYSEGCTRCTPRPPYEGFNKEVCDYVMDSLRGAEELLWYIDKRYEMKRRKE